MNIEGQIDILSSYTCTYHSTHVWIPIASLAYGRGLQLSSWICLSSKSPYI